MKWQCATFVLSPSSKKFVFLSKNALGFISNFFVISERTFFEKLSAPNVFSEGFSVPTTKTYESKFPKSFQTSLNKSKTFFENRKLTSVRICLNFCLIMFKSTIFVTQNRKLLIFSSRMCDFLRKIVCISILNCHPGNKYKIEGSWFVSKSFCYSIFTNFPKKN